MESKKLIIQFIIFFFNSSEFNTEAYKLEILESFLSCERADLIQDACIKICKRSEFGLLMLDNSMITIKLICEQS